MSFEEGEEMSQLIAVPAEGAVEIAPAGPVVEAHELTRRYGEGGTAVDALRGIDLEISRGKLTAVMGPSGSGKSTLMHILAALDKPTGGYVMLAGNRLGELSDTEITKLPASSSGSRSPARSSRSRPSSSPTSRPETSTRRRAARSWN